MATKTLAIGTKVEYSGRLLKLKNPCCYDSATRGLTLTSGKVIKPVFVLDGAQFACMECGKRYSEPVYECCKCGGSDIDIT